MLWKSIQFNLDALGTYTQPRNDYISPFPEVAPISIGAFGFWALSGSSVSPMRRHRLRRSPGRNLQGWLGRVGDQATGCASFTLTSGERPPPIRAIRQWA